jgi:hypothetical protein
MAKKKRERSTARMPSGAQQYTRGDDSQARLRNVDDLIRSRRLTNLLDGGDTSQGRAERSALHEAFMDEADRSRAAYQNQMQALQDTSANRRKRGFVEGGEVRGCKAGQMSGKGFSGSY